MSNNPMNCFFHNMSEQALHQKNKNTQNNKIIQNILQNKNIKQTPIYNKMSKKRQNEINQMLK